MASAWSIFPSPLSGFQLRYVQGICQAISCEAILQTHSIMWLMMDDDDDDDGDGRIIRNTVLNKTTYIPYRQPEKYLLFIL